MAEGREKDVFNKQIPSFHTSTPRPDKSESSRKRPGSDCEICLQYEIQIKPRIGNLVV